MLRDLQHYRLIVPELVAEDLGVPERRVRDAFETLVRKNYIQRLSDGDHYAHLQDFEAIRSFQHPERLYLPTKKGASLLNSA